MKYSISAKQHTTIKHTITSTIPSPIPYHHQYHTLVHHQQTTIPKPAPSPQIIRDTLCIPGPLAADLVAANQGDFRIISNIIHTAQGYHHHDHHHHSDHHKPLSSSASSALDKNWCGLRQKTDGIS